MSYAEEEEKQVLFIIYRTSGQLLGVMGLHPSTILISSVNMKNIPTFLPTPQTTGFYVVQRMHAFVLLEEHFCI